MDLNRDGMLDVRAQLSVVNQQLQDLQTNLTNKSHVPYLQRHVCEANVMQTNMLL